jgi:hypothetical protein
MLATGCEGMGGCDLLSACACDQDHLDASQSADETNACTSAPCSHPFQAEALASGVHSKAMED